MIVLQHPRSVAIATFALCGFANFGSVGIQLGGMGTMAPGRRGDLADVALRSMLTGAMVGLLNACMAGEILPVLMIVLDVTHFEFPQTLDTILGKPS